MGLHFVCFLLQINKHNVSIQPTPITGDVVVWSFLPLHQYYLKDKFQGIGMYTLKTKYISAKIDISEIFQFTVLPLEDSLNNIRENQFVAHTEHGHISEGYY
jgi:hypothetical protein